MDVDVSKPTTGVWAGVYSVGVRGVLGAVRKVAGQTRVTTLSCLGCGYGRVTKEGMAQPAGRPRFDVAATRRPAVYHAACVSAICSIARHFVLAASLWRHRSYPATSSKMFDLCYYHVAIVLAMNLYCNKILQFLALRNTALLCLLLNRPSSVKVQSECYTELHFRDTFIYREGHHSTIDRQPPYWYQHCLSESLVGNATK